MSDLIGFEGHLNETAPFHQQGYKVEYKSNTTYLDFSFKNDYKEKCEYPRFWNESGQLVLATVDRNFSELVGCYDSEFDQVSGREPLLEECPELTISSTATPKLLATSQIGSDSFRSLRRCKIACESGNPQSARRSSISCAYS
jgi:hypothetical protein